MASQAGQDKRQAAEERFIEEVGLALEASGFPRMAGKIIGRLLISVPPEQSAAELAEALHASRGSISTMTRLLLHSSIIERVSRPGRRGDLFRMNPNGWIEVAKQQLRRIDGWRRLAEQGEALVAGQPPEMRQRIEDFKELLDFYQAEVPRFLAEWEKRRNERRQHDGGH